MAHYVTRKKLAELAQVHPATVTGLLRRKMRAALANNRVDLEHPTVVEYLKNRVAKGVEIPILAELSPNVTVPTEGPAEPVTVEAPAPEDMTSMPAPDAGPEGPPKKPLTKVRPGRGNGPGDARRKRADDIDRIPRDVVDVVFDSVKDKFREFVTDRASMMALAVCRRLGGIEVLPVIEDIIRSHNQQAVDDLIDVVEKEINSL